MSKDRQEFVEVAFFVVLILMLLFIMHKKNKEIERECHSMCMPLAYHVKQGINGYDCACEERNPGVIEMKYGK
jgi:hypothetical protein